MAEIAVALYMGVWIEIFKTGHFTCLVTCRTLHECVDWNPLNIKVELHTVLSHSTWVLGLKFSAVGGLKNILTIVLDLGVKNMTLAQ